MPCLAHFGAFVCAVSSSWNNLLCLGKSFRPLLKIISSGKSQFPDSGDQIRAPFHAHSVSFIMAYKNIVKFRSE